jgi:hypothetical protein
MTGISPIFFTNLSFLNPEKSFNPKRQRLLSTNNNEKRIMHHAKNCSEETYMNVDSHPNHKIINPSFEAPVYKYAYRHWYIAGAPFCGRRVITPG